MSSYDVSGFSWSGGIHAGDEGKRRERRIKGDSMAQSEDGARRSELEDGIGQDGVNHMTGRGGAERHWRSDGIWEGERWEIPS